MHGGGCNVEYECHTISLLPKSGTTSYVLPTSGKCFGSYYNCFQAWPASGNVSGCLAEAAMHSINIIQFHCCHNLAQCHVFQTSGNCLGSYCNHSQARLTSGEPSRCPAEAAMHSTNICRVSTSYDFTAATIQHNVICLLDIWKLLRIISQVFPSLAGIGTALWMTGRG